MGIFSIFKRKSKHLSVVEYDKLVDSKEMKIREFVRLNLHVTRDNRNFEEEFAKAFELYAYNLKQELSKTAYKRIIPFRRKQVLSPINALQEFNHAYRRRRKVVWYKKFFRFFRSIKFYAILFLKDLFLRYELRKIKKLFPDYNLSNQTALNLMKSVSLNKRAINIH